MVDMPSPMGGNRFRPYIKAIIEAERAPIKQIETRKSRDNERLKLLQEFSGKVRKMNDLLRDLDNFRKFRELRAEFGKNDDLIDVAIDKNIAEPGEYQLEITQLAGRYSMISNGFDAPDAEVGVGFFSYTLPDGQTYSKYLDSDHNTLESIARMINNDKKLNLQAMIVNDGTDSDAPWRMIVAGKKTGMNQDIIFPDFYFVDGDMQFSIDDERYAQSAIVKLNGFEIMCPINVLKEMIPGVAITLKQDRDGYEFTLNIVPDISKIAAKVKALVDSMNGVLEFINKQNQLDEKSDTKKTLGGDGMLRTIEIQLRNLILNQFGIDPEDEDAMMRASDLGISFERTGLLSFNQDKFQKVLTEKFDEVATFFTDEAHFIDRLKITADSLLRGGNGLLVMRERSFQDQMHKMDDQIAQKERMLGQREEALKRQFATIEGFIQNMQNQQNYISSTLGSGNLLQGIG